MARQRKDISRGYRFLGELSGGVTVLLLLFVHSGVAVLVPGAVHLGRGYQLDFVVNPLEPSAGETTVLSATLILSSLGIPQVHVDWILQIVSDTEALLRQEGHSNTGHFAVTFIFPSAGIYRVHVTISGILFAPILPLETDVLLSVKPPGQSPAEGVVVTVQAIAAVVISALAVGLGVAKLRRPLHPSPP